DLSSVAFDKCRRCSRSRRAHCCNCSAACRGLVSGGKVWAAAAPPQFVGDWISSTAAAAESGSNDNVFLLMTAPSRSRLGYGQLASSVIGRLQFKKLCVLSATGHQLIVRTLFMDLAVSEDDYSTGHAYCGEAMRN